MENVLRGLLNYQKTKLSKDSHGTKRIQGSATKMMKRLRLRLALYKYYKNNTLRRFIYRDTYSAVYNSISQK